MWQRFTERARRVVFFAQEEAGRLGENYVGTEHLLLGLVRESRESESVATRILARLDVPLARIRADVERQVTRGHGSLGQDMLLTPRAKRVIDLAYEEARQLNNNYIGTEHILLGLICEKDGIAARILVKLGVGAERARREVSAMREEHDATASTVEGEREKELQSLTPEELPARRRAGSARMAELVVEVEALRSMTERHRLVREALRAGRQVCVEMPDLISIADLDSARARALVQLGLILERTSEHYCQLHQGLLGNQALALVFEKPSLRTRVTFETAMFQCGGRAIHLGPQEIGLGTREPAADVARNLERWVQGVAARTFSHATIVELADHADIPVINALSDFEHPCQALADMLTLLDKRGRLEGQKLAYVGDGNNMAHSLVALGAKLGLHVTLACPEGYQPSPGVLEAARADAAQSGGSVALTTNPRAAVEGVDAVYTDVWTSMGQEDEAAERERLFRPYQLNAELLALADPEAVVMHCLPAHRGLEITAEVLDGPRSVAFDQAENRLHAQKAVLAVLLGGAAAEPK